MFIISKTQEASLNFEQKYNTDALFREFLTKGFKPDFDTRGEPDQVRIYESAKGEILGYIVMYGTKGCYVVSKEHANKFLKQIGWYLKNPKSLCYRYTDEQDFETQEVVNVIFDDPRAKAYRDRANELGL